MEIVRQRIFVPNGKTEDGRQLYRDYGMAHISVGNVAGLEMSGEYVKRHDPVPNDNAGIAVGELMPQIRTNPGRHADEATGFI